MWPSPWGSNPGGTQGRSGVPEGHVHVLHGMDGNETRVRLQELGVRVKGGAEFHVRYWPRLCRKQRYVRYALWMMENGSRTIFKRPPPIFGS